MKRLERGLDEVRAKVSEHESRIVKLETQRDADKREMQAEISRFKTEVERFELRLSRQLPPSNS